MDLSSFCLIGVDVRGIPKLCKKPLLSGLAEIGAVCVVRDGSSRSSPGSEHSSKLNWFETGKAGSLLCPEL